MGLFKRISKAYRAFFNLSLTDPKAWDSSLWNLRGALSQSGEVVNEYTALNYSAFWCAVRLISDTISALPLNLMQNRGKKKKIVDSIPLYSIMHDKWNPYMTAMVGRGLLMDHALTWGNGYAEIVRNGIGDIVELWPITPDRVTPKMKEGELVYDIRVGNETITLKREKILHFPGPGFDGFVGYSIVSLARKSISLGMAMETFGELYFGQGTHPGVIVTHPETLSETAHANMKKSLTENYSGLGKSHRLMLLDEGMTIKDIGIPPEDSQFLESRQFQIPEIARWFNLPPHKLKDMTKSSFNNIESEQISFYTDSILPWLVRLEQNYRLQLFTQRQYQQEKLYFKHVVLAILRGSASDRANFYKTAIGFGWMTPNEVRELEDMDPHDNPLADSLWMPANLQPLAKYEENQAKKEEQSLLPTPDEEESPDEEQPEEIPENKLRLLRLKN